MISATLRCSKPTPNSSRRTILKFALGIAGAILSLILFNANVMAQTRVPLLFGENKNERGEYVPMPERLTKMFQFVEKDLNIKFEFQMYPWNRAVKIASSEGGLIFGLSRTPEREEIFQFSEPALYNYLWLVTRRDKRFPFQQLTDLRGKTIGVVRGARYGGEFDAQKNSLFRVDDDIDAYGTRLQKVLNGRVDAMLIASSSNDAAEVEKQVNQIRVLEQELVAPAARFSVLTTPVLRDGICFAHLKAKDTALLNRISIALAKYYAQESKLTKARSKNQR